MKKSIKIKFVGFPSFHDPHAQTYFRFLQDRYDVIECDNPDYIIDSGLTFEHERYDCIKIVIHAENFVPDFNSYDYAIACADMRLGDRYVRIPWFVFYPYFEDIQHRKTTSDEALLNRKFCSFVVSNNEFGDPVRRRFFEELSKYKKVDSGGRYMNNVGGPVVDKLEFCRRYKFNIAFENCAYPGYTTEKIMESYVSQSVPIYYGNPSIEQDFLPESMVRVRGLDDIQRAVEEVIRLDQDDDAYMRMATSACLTEGDPAIYEKRLEEFLAYIFDQPLEKAGRLSQYGYQQMIHRHLRPIRLLDQSLRDSVAFKFATRIYSKIRSR